jgi:membrane-bound lytic murein transglycosylase D
MHLKNLALAALVLPLMAACSTLSGSHGHDDVSDAAVAGVGGSTSGDLSDSGSDLDALPLEVNKNVLQWIDYFQGRGRPHMERYLQRSTRYMPIMKKILKDNGLPEDLIYIALIESGFSSTAHSSASAVGFWQFIKGTGKSYHLQIDSLVDERRDFVRSTQAAADYFKGLYNLFGAWYLAIASYNVGENRVKNLVMKNHTRDFWKLARENRLPDETSNYVPKFLAARLIAKDPEKYGFTDIEYMPPLAFAEVQFNTSIDIRKLATGLSVEYDDLRDLNPSYKRGVAYLKNGKLTLRVPVGMETQAVAAAEASAAGDKKVYVADEDYSYYRVRRGDSIATIAKKFGTSQTEIRSLNHLSRGARLVSGRRLRVPAEQIEVAAGKKSTEGSSSAKKTQTLAPKQVAARELQSAVSSDTAERLRQPASPKVHVVLPGENLTQIARKYGTTIRQLAAANQISRRSRVTVGARLEIP